MTFDKKFLFILVVNKEVVMFLKVFLKFKICLQ